ncbi:hypothetical protein EVJ58_g5672 [Rhodofomes roseus]|uniref:Uncharacterized protein n=1 Tax=Rhodofomes roseus TaxID=34475 RepID=A0A4Y9YDT9_9APHY|nr:hypothetical protein EVJ58_g5672 [Rhodofomes roseus]
MGLRWPSPLTIPILVVVPDYRARVTCSSGLQVHLHTPGRFHQHQVQPKAKRSPLSARDANAPDGEPDATTVTDGETPITMSPSSLPATVVVEPRDLYDSDDYTSGGYSDSYTSGGGYSATYTSSGYYTTPTATSYSASGTYTPSGNGMSSVSGNSSSVSVVTTTATRTSVRTVTSVSTDIETMLTTVTGPDSTGVFTTT